MGSDTQGEAATDDASTTQPPSRPEVLEPAVALNGALKAMARLNRNTTWVAAGLLGSVVFAAVMVAVRDPHPKSDDTTDVSPQVKSDLLPNSHPSPDFSVASSTEKSAGEITSGQAASVDSGSTSQIKQDRPAVQAIATPWSPAPRPHFVRDSRPKIPNLRHRSSKRPGIVSLKLRKITLWFRSLVRNERSHSGTRSSR
jgi:hypothetical protein